MPLELVVKVNGEWVGGNAGVVPPPTAETRNPEQWPFAANSIINTPIGSGAIVGDIEVRHPVTDAIITPGHPWANAFKSVTATINLSNYTTPINIGKAGDAPVTINPVDPGRWTPPVESPVVVARAPASIQLSGDMAAAVKTYNDNGTVTYSGGVGTPDGFLALMDEELHTVTELFKGNWHKDGPSSRTLIGLTTRVYTLDLKGDHHVIPGMRASRFGITAGLIRRSEMTKAAIDPPNAIRHALVCAMNNSQLLRPTLDTHTDEHPAYVSPGIQHPARGVDGNANSVYTGPIRMGALFKLHPSFDIEASGLTNEGKALAYACRDYGVYVTDRSLYVSLYAEHANALYPQFTNMKNDWQAVISKNMAPVLNNTSVNIGGPGARVRPLAPAFEE